MDFSVLKVVWGLLCYHLESGKKEDWSREHLSRNDWSLTPAKTEWGTEAAWMMCLEEVMPPCASAPLRVNITVR